MSDLNDRIAKAKGWRWSEVPSLIAPYQSVDGLTTFRSSVPTHWYNPKAEPAFRPDFANTVEGVTGMLRELGPKWVWGWDGIGMVCQRGAHPNLREWFTSSVSRPADCVGSAWLSVFGKEAVSAV